MSAIERGLYVTVGAADLAAEKVRELPAVKIVVERTNKLRTTSLIDQAREIEPKVRKQAEELQARGQKVVKRLQKEAKERREAIREFPQEARNALRDFPDSARNALRDFPDSARKQIQEFPDSARKQATELRGRIEKALGREEAKPAPKTSAKAAASSATKAS